MLADPIDQYLDRLRGRLPTGDPSAARMVLEAERDLRAAANRFAAGGWTREEAAAQAIAQYPTVETLAQRYALDAAFAVSVSGPVKAALSATIVLTGLLVLAGAAFALGLPGLGFAERAVKVLLSLAVVGHGAVTLWLLWSKRLNMAAQRATVFFGGLMVAVLGGVLTIWSLHLGASTGEWEGYALLRGPLIALQGGFAAWVVLPRVWSPWLE